MQAVIQAAIQAAIQAGKHIYLQVTDRQACIYKGIHTGIHKIIHAGSTGKHTIIHTNRQENSHRQVNRYAVIQSYRQA